MATLAGLGINFESFVKGFYKDFEAKYLTSKKEISKEVEEKYLQVFTINDKHHETFLQGKLPYAKIGWETYVNYINNLRTEND